MCTVHGVKHHPILYDKVISLRMFVYAMCMVVHLPAGFSCFFVVVFILFVCLFQSTTVAVD